MARSSGWKHEGSMPPHSLTAPLQYSLMIFWAGKWRKPTLSDRGGVKVGQDNRKLHRGYYAKSKQGSEANASPAQKVIKQLLTK